MRTVRVSPAYFQPLNCQNNCFVRHCRFHHAKSSILLQWRRKRDCVVQPGHAALAERDSDAISWVPQIHPIVADLGQHHDQHHAVGDCSASAGCVTCPLPCLFLRRRLDNRVFDSARFLASFALHVRLLSSRSFAGLLNTTHEYVSFAVSGPSAAEYNVPPSDAVVVYPKGQFIAVRS